ncbi:MAG: Riboflavin synthase [Actinomycetota bacterium]
MFTGLVQAQGSVLSLDQVANSAVLKISAPADFDDVALGESIAINGVCLTVTNKHFLELDFDVMGETLNLTNLGTLSSGNQVNLERALKISDRLGGHIVQGHVDGRSQLLSRSKEPNWEVLTFELNDSFARYVVKKGSITVDGVSLTVSDVGDSTFEVSLIPTTLVSTNLGELAVGKVVNIEVDVIAKYVESMIGRENLS